MYGWTGKILWVNLTDRKIKITDPHQLAENYPGGRGIAARIYWDGVSPEINVFDPGNRLIFMTRPFVAPPRRQPLAYVL